MPIHRLQRWWLPGRLWWYRWCGCRGKAITFSGHPEFIDLQDDTSLRDKLEIMRAYSDVANTNIEAVFNLILDMAKCQNVPREESFRSRCWSYQIWSLIRPLLPVTCRGKMKNGTDPMRHYFERLKGDTKKTAIECLVLSSGMCVDGQIRYQK